MIWEFSLDAYDQFFCDRGLFGDEPCSIEWTYVAIFWRSIWQAGAATLFALIIGFPTAYFIATRPAHVRPLWVFLITIPYWVNLLIRTVSMKFLLRDQGPMNDFLIVQMFQATKGNTSVTWSVGTTTKETNPHARSVQVESETQSRQIKADQRRSL